MDILGLLSRDYSATHSYLPIFIFLLFAFVFAAGTLVAAFFIRPHRPDPEKLSPYECGVPPIMGARERFSVRFFIVAMLFLLFDVEAIFLYPWAVLYNRSGIFGFIEIMLFLTILLVGYVYARKKGALEWE
ncbi:MAG: NADH-quinone oxidoreductase subunit A [Candidatus Tectomicrobia bacterium]|uniref:NADH-quinone oxidoreductase subunit A n=1 Tax=Tectimicrobiota bacterium TaxID=2528274 RepID=A0A932CLL1_UNCTE|nr:NADH-quinone oxidoreductase subunit A [Candidatus Tectomicrobia bacterium]